MVLQSAGEVVFGEPAALVNTEDLGPAVPAERFLDQQLALFAAASATGCSSADLHRATAAL
jgi:hypothetical protein